MEITATELIEEYEHASARWPFIHQTELAHGLPRMMLFAIGSRETNLTNEVGDGGHGHGVWQLDDRWHQRRAGSGTSTATCRCSAPSRRTCCTGC